MNWQILLEVDWQLWQGSNRSMAPWYQHHKSSTGTYWSLPLVRWAFHLVMKSPSSWHCPRRGKSYQWCKQFALCQSLDPDFFGGSVCAFLIVKLPSIGFWFLQKTQSNKNERRHSKIKTKTVLIVHLENSEFFWFSAPLLPGPPKNSKKKHSP